VLRTKAAKKLFTPFLFQRKSRCSPVRLEDGLIGPLALSFDTEVSADLFERRYDILPKKLSIRSDGQVPISSSGGSYPVIRRHRDQEFARSRYCFYRGLRKVALYSQGVHELRGRSTPRGRSLHRRATLRGCAASGPLSRQSISGPRRRHRSRGAPKADHCGGGAPFLVATSPTARPDVAF
jgi:hypothetical protein